MSASLQQSSGSGYYSILGNGPTFSSSSRVTTILPDLSKSGSSYYDGEIEDEELYQSSINYITSANDSVFDGIGNYLNNYNNNNFDSSTSSSSSAAANSSFSSSVGSTSSWFLVIILSSIIVITIVGNILVCLAVILVRKLRKPQNYLLVSLATSDLFVALFVMPFATVAEFHENRWPLNPALCDLWVSADVLCCTASILNLCGISLDRYRAITSPLEYSAKTSPKRMLAVIFVVWLGSACVSLPPLLLLGNEHFDADFPEVPICTVSQNFWYQIYATMMSFYVPLCVMVVVYVKILRVVADKKKDMSYKSRPATKQHHHTNNSVLVVKNNSSNKSSLSHKRHLKADSIRLNNKSHNGGPLLPQIQQPTQSQISNTNATSAAATATTTTTTSSTGPGQVGFIFPSTNAITTTTTTTTNTSTLHRLKKGQLPLLRNKLLGGLREHKASTTLGIIMSAFIICWLPFFVLALVRPFFSNYVEIPGWISSLFLWLGYTNSALNPVIYATLNRDFRRPFKEILCLRCSTLDVLMRREFYNQQFGEDTETLRHTTKQTLNSSSRLHHNAEADTPTHL